MWDRARHLLVRSLTYRLIFSYLVILGIGGLVTSLVGSWIVSSTLMDLGRRTATHDLTTARTIYQHQIDDIRRVVELTASGVGLRPAFLSRDTAAIRGQLEAIATRSKLDFVTVTDRRGRVILRVARPEARGDNTADINVVRAALRGDVAAGTAILTAAQLIREDPALAERARMDLVPTRRASGDGRIMETSGMALIAAAPLLTPEGRTVGALYAGRLLNRNFEIVDHVWNLIYGGGSTDDHHRVGSVTIFQGDVRISTNVREESGERALGTRASDAVAQAVLGRGSIWNARAYVVHDWYMSAYEPIRDYDDEIIGMLYVGLPENLFTASRDRVIISFFAIAGLAFVAIIVTTFAMIRSVTRPLGEMAVAARRISAGDFDIAISADSPGEIGLLAQSFNTMLQGLRQMKEDLEDWGRTLERRVAERSEELVAMQTRVAESERLASLGMLAAGVAHEINNPMGGILALTSLSLEDMQQEDPHRPNLEEVVRQTERCRDIVRGLLEFSRQSQAGTELVDFNEVVRRTLSLIANQALFFNIRLVQLLDPTLPRIVADRSQLEQVCMNLIVNAAQSVDGPGTVTIRTSHQTDLDQVELRVSDTGRGIEPDKVSRIFDPFFTTKDDGQGTGLGLSIVYGIVTKYNGSIAVESEIGHGSTFIIRFPVARTPEDG
jgi:two-component system, NtrC family, sensor kinase